MKKLFFIKRAERRRQREENANKRQLKVSQPLQVNGSRLNNILLHYLVHQVLLLILQILEWWMKINFMNGTSCKKLFYKTRKIENGWF